MMYILSLYFQLQICHRYFIRYFPVGMLLLLRFILCLLQVFVTAFSTAYPHLDTDIIYYWNLVTAISYHCIFNCNLMIDILSSISYHWEFCHCYILCCLSQTFYHSIFNRYRSIIYILSLELLSLIFFCRNDSSATLYSVFIAGILSLYF